MTSSREWWASFHALLTPRYRALRYSGGKGAYHALAPQGDAMLWVEYQRDAREPEPRVRFCVELRVYLLPLIDARRRGRAPRAIVARENPHWRERLAPEPGMLDFWWNIDASEARGGEVAIDWHLRAIEERVHPRLREVGSASALQALWSSPAFDGLTDIQRSRYLAALEGR